MFISDPDFISIPDHGVKKLPDPGSGEATLRYTTGTLDIVYRNNVVEETASAYVSEGFYFFSLY